MIVLERILNFFFPCSLSVELRFFAMYVFSEMWIGRWLGETNQRSRNVLSTAKLWEKVNWGTFFFFNTKPVEFWLITMINCCNLIVALINGYQKWQLRWMKEMHFLTTKKILFVFIVSCFGKVCWSSICFWCFGFHWKKQFSVSRTIWNGKTDHLLLLLFNRLHSDGVVPVDRFWVLLFVKMSTNCFVGLAWLCICPLVSTKPQWHKERNWQQNFALQQR